MKKTIGNIIVAALVLMSTGCEGWLNVKPYDKIAQDELLSAEEGKEYIVHRIDTDDEELNAFLFSLGCYSGEAITVIANRRSGCTVSIKDGRYTIDNQLAATIEI